MALEQATFVDVSGEPVTARGLHEAMPNRTTLVALRLSAVRSAELAGEGAEVSRDHDQFLRGEGDADPATGHIHYDPGHAIFLGVGILFDLDLTGIEMRTPVLDQRCRQAQHGESGLHGCQGGHDQAGFVTVLPRPYRDRTVVRLHSGPFAPFHPADRHALSPSVVLWRKVIGLGAVGKRAQ